MVSNKKRLYVALYPSGVSNNEERKYHWGFLIGPKVENKPQVPGTRYHVKNHPVGGWTFEELPLRDVQNTTNLLGRVLIAKITDEDRLVGILRNIPIIQNDPNWRCRTWVSSALEAISRDGNAVGTSELNWQKIQATARKYVADKTAAGRYRSADDLSNPKPVWDILECKERVP